MKLVQNYRVKRLASGIYHLLINLTGKYYYQCCGHYEFIIREDYEDESNDRLEIEPFLPELSKGCMWQRFDNIEKDQITVVYIPMCIKEEYKLILEVGFDNANNIQNSLLH